MSVFIRLFFILLVGIAFSTEVQSKVVISETTDEGMDCFRIDTESATYFYQIEAGGFSSILDKNGNDWLGYNRSKSQSYPQSAASDYRGLPNLVFRSDDGGCGHPGFDKCISIKVNANTIRSFSKSGKWQWSWTFTENDAVLIVEAVDPEHAYWFLYEGPIAGKFDPENQYWGNSQEGPIHSFPDYVKSGSIYDQWSWVYFGSKAFDRVLVIEHLTPDFLPDTMGYMGNSQNGLDSEDGMVVFGFGRYKRAQPLMTKEHNVFRIQFVEKSIRSKEDHSLLSEVLNAKE